MFTDICCRRTRKSPRNTTENHDKVGLLRDEACSRAATSPFTGKGRGLAKKGGGGGGYTWGALGSELLEEYNEDLDEDDLADLQYNQAKAKLLAESASAPLETKMTKLELIESMDKDVKPLIDEYFVNGDAKDVAQSLRRFDVKQHGGGELFAYILTMALEKSNVHKELISRLLHDLNGIILRPNDFISGFNTLLTTLNDLSLDNPECSTDIGRIDGGCRVRRTSRTVVSFQANSLHVRLPTSALTTPIASTSLSTKAMSNARRCKPPWIKPKRSSR